jgi:hypothetical protein
MLEHMNDGKKAAPKKETNKKDTAGLKKIILNVKEFGKY